MNIEDLITLLKLGASVRQIHLWSWDLGHSFFHYINGEDADDSLDNLWSYNDFEDEPRIEVVVTESDDHPGAPCYSETLQLKLHPDDAA